MIQWHTLSCISGNHSWDIRIFYETKANLRKELIFCKWLLHKQQSSFEMLLQCRKFNKQSYHIYQGNYVCKSDKLFTCLVAYDINNKVILDMSNLSLCLVTFMNYNNGKLC